MTSTNKQDTKQLLALAQLSACAHESHCFWACTLWFMNILLDTHICTYKYVHEYHCRIRHKQTRNVLCVASILNSASLKSPEPACGVTWLRAISLRRAPLRSRGCGALCDGTGVKKDPSQLLKLCLYVPWRKLLATTS